MNPLLAEFRASLPAILEGHDPMAVPDGHIRCNQCRMTFEIGGYPNYSDSERTHGQTTICAEPGCQRRFWHLGAGKRYDICRVGIFPSDARSLE